MRRWNFNELSRSWGNGIPSSNGSPICLPAHANLLRLERAWCGVEQGKNLRSQEGKSSGREVRGEEEVTAATHAQHSSLAHPSFFSAGYRDCKNQGFRIRKTHVGIPSSPLTSSRSLGSGSL